MVECLIENGAKVDVQDDGEIQLVPTSVFLGSPTSNSIVLLLLLSAARRWNSSNVHLYIPRRF